MTIQAGYQSLATTLPTEKPPPQISLTNPTSTNLSTGMFIFETFALVLSLNHKKISSTVRLNTLLLPCSRRNCSLPTIYTTCVLKAESRAARRSETVGRFVLGALLLFSS